MTKTGTAKRDFICPIVAVKVGKKVVRRGQRIAKDDKFSVDDSIYDAAPSEARALIDEHLSSKRSEDKEKKTP